MRLHKCPVIVVSIGPGGLSVKRPCGKPAVRRFGHQAYCDRHLSEERARLHMDALAQGSRITLTRTSDGTKYALEPGGVVVRSQVFQKLAALGLLVPERDTLFPDLDLPAQSWRLRPGAAE
jgi:hypothetical protein